ncbi:MAG TPA: hypothetical protein PJ987_09485 [Bacteroidia bacterium]|nr:hypothetical protein [Bacteroidia bacterium]HMY42190.1 hypothetical protein [Chitinophagales bacterium]
MATKRIKTRTYRELLEVLNKLEPSQLNQDITLKDNQEEYYGLEIVVSEEEEDDVLDEGHPYFEIEAEIKK